MASQNKPFSRVRLVFRRSSTLLKCVVLATIVLSTAALLTLRASVLEARAEAEALRAQAAALEQENEQLRQQIDQLGTVQSVIDIAGDELGLVDPNTSFFSPTESTIPDQMEETN